MRRKIAWLLSISISVFFLPNSFEPALADVISYNFTTAGSSGMYGPIQESVTAAYLGTTLEGAVRVAQRGYQLWTVPATDTYTIEAAGAAGGSTTYSTGGRGRIIKINVRLTQGQVLKIVVGQLGGKVQFTSGGPGTAGGGGGGTFVVDSATAAAILISGGGGGGSSDTTNTGVNGQDAPAETVTAGTNGTNRGGWSGAAGGTNGQGGASSSNAWTANSGAGFLTNGGGNTQSSTYSVPHSFASDAIGGMSGQNGLTTVIHGGFGGGSGPLGTGSYEANPGAGGGYSGGGGGGHVGTGGGGGNYMTGQFVSSGLNSGNGYVTITRNLVAATLMLSGSSSFSFRTDSTITANSNSPGRVTFLSNGKRIPGCISLLLTGSASNYSATCTWRPSTRGSANVTATITPSGGYSPATSSLNGVGVNGRTSTR